VKRAVRLLAVALVALACATPKPPPVEAQPDAIAAPAPPAIAEPAAPVEPGADRSQPPPLGPNPPLVLPRQEHFVLANGLRVRVVEQHRLPIVALNLVVDAGASRDPAPLPGLASFTAEMLTEGTARRTATQISDDLGLLGASLGGAAGSDSATVSGECLSEHLARFLELFADVAVHPSFPAADFERVQDERRVALLQARDQPAAVAGIAFASAFWGDHPYGHPIIGTEAGLSRTRRTDLAQFHGRFWRPDNAELVVVGDVTWAGLQPLLDRTLGSWKRGSKASPLPGRGPSAPHRTVLIEKRGASQTYLSLGAPGLERRSPDFVAAKVMFEVLGGGTSSRLFRILREQKGYTYGIGAGADARRLGGASVVRGSVKAGVTGAALRDLLAELARLRDEPVPAEELQEAEAGIVRGLPSEFSSVEEIAFRLGDLAVHGLPDDYWNGYAQAVEKIGPADVQRVAQRVLDPARLTIVMVGPADLVRPQLGSLPIGKVEVQRPTNPPLPRKPIPGARGPVVAPAGLK
jgi:predicted Zn-dependent peptidase